MTSQQSADLVNKISFHHVYGQIGYLPWQDKSPVVEFGKNPSADDLFEIYDTIKTFTQGTNADTSEIKAIHSAIHKANRIVFLGFAFHSLNMKILESPDKPTLGTPIFATTAGISEDDLDHISEALCLCFSTDRKILKLRDKHCNEFLQNFWRSLSYSS